MERTLYKEDIQDVMDFLITVPHEAWITDNQTNRQWYDGLKSRYQHCYLGHVNLNPQSPFVIEENKSAVKITHTHSSSASECTGGNLRNLISLRINDKSLEILGKQMHRINNAKWGPYQQDEIKDRVMAALSDLKKLLPIKPE